jgi:hypothetical protein
MDFRIVLDFAQILANFSRLSLCKIAERYYKERHGRGCKDARIILCQHGDDVGNINQK